MMRGSISEALWPFLGGAEPPYDIEAVGPDQGTVRVDPAVSTTGFAAPKMSGMAHHISAVAYIAEPAPMQIAARFLCGEKSADVVIVPEPTSEDVVCARCVRYSQRYPALYRLFDATGRLLYVGATVDVLQRFIEHERRTPWWGEVAEKQIERFDSIAEARRAEASAIRLEAPLHNKLMRRAALGSSS